MPHGISGLLIAPILAAAMSNLSAALNSLSSSSIMDFYLRLRPATGDQQRLRASRFSTLFWAAILFGLAILCLHRVSRVIEVGLQIASVAYGALLGVFLLGVLTKRANQWAPPSDFSSDSRPASTYGSSPRSRATWHVPIGTVVTFGIGYLASTLVARRLKVHSALCPEANFQL